MNRPAFFSAVRKAPFGGKLAASQISGMEAILDEWDRRKLTDLRWLAYMLATTFHETAFTMQPITERGNKSYFNKYNAGTKIGKVLGNTEAGDGYLFRGRGYVQLTGRANYIRAGLAATPEVALVPSVAATVMFNGMTQGWFTGKRLATYFNASKEDWKNARRIINGTDKAVTIAKYALAFHRALQAAMATITLASPSAPPATSTDTVTLKPGQLPPLTMTDAEQKKALEIANVQKKLRELGYYSVGAVDGDKTPKGMTEAAILNFRNRHDLPLTIDIDAEFLAALAIAAPIDVGSERATMTVAEVRVASPELAPVLNASWWDRLVKLVLAAGSFLGALVWGAIENLGGAVEKLTPLREFLADVPVPVWFVLVAAISGGLYLINRKTDKATATLYNRGVVT